MGIVRMRNKITGEFQDVDDGSVDFIRMKRQVGPDGQSKWEQTGDHDVRATMRRAQLGELLETDLGKSHFPLPINAGHDVMLSPEYAPHKALTAGEIENGLTSQEQKAEQEADMHMRALLSWADENQVRSAREQAEQGEGPLASHPAFRRERAIEAGTTAILERSEVEGLEEEDTEEKDKASTRQRRSRTGRSRSGGPKSDDDVQVGKSEESEA